ncbi:SidA/IucD/PvdA family monooxygenase, partial [Serratia sp. CY74664]|uniref:SidA/IucD/PvdA family monooxygenase n=1 Tax=Serratia sp. CY74664 TaxID=3383676 RepID=UPI003FA15681
MNEPLDLIGVGLGPFNLSLAALAAESGAVNYTFLDSAEEIDGIESRALRDVIAVPETPDPCNLFGGKSHMA